MRVRHYTRVSSMRRIVAEQRIRARDQNKVFVELADRRRLAPNDAEDRYGLDHGKGNACVEFDVEPEVLLSQYNSRMQLNEYFVIGDIELVTRNAEAFFNF